MSHHPERLQALFPDDKGLVTWGAESYCGVPLLESSGAVVGHLAIIDDKPMRDGPRGLSIMRIFAARARAEIERLRAETALRVSEERYKDLYDEAPAGTRQAATAGGTARGIAQPAEQSAFPLDHCSGRASSTF